MASNRIEINGKQYTVGRNAQNPLAPDGPLSWNMSYRPSQSGDPARDNTAEWNVDGPCLNSFEEISEGAPKGKLATDYTVNADTRWDGQLTLGPLITSETLTVSSTYVINMLPTGDLSVQGFTPSAGANWQNVDDAVGANDGDATYNFVTGGVGDLFYHTASGLPIGTPITKATVTFIVRKTATGTPTTVHGRIAQPNHTAVSLTQTVGAAKLLVDNTLFQTFSDDYTTSPTTGAAWTVPEIDALIIGYDGSAAGSEVRVTQVYLTVTAGTPNVNAMEIMDGPSGERFLYVAAGKDLVKVYLSTSTVVSAGGATYTDYITSLLSTTTASGTKEMSVGFGTNAYDVFTGIGQFSAADTHGANTASGGAKVYRILRQATDRVVGLINGKAEGIVLSGVTMAAPVTGWANVATLSGKPNIQCTGFAQDGMAWILGSNYGPYLLNPETLNFEPLIDEMGQNMENCRAMGRWSFLHVLIPTVTGLRYQKDGDSASIGPEEFGNNTSPVAGFVTAIAGTSRGFFAAVYNQATGDTYLCFCRPPHHQEDVTQNLGFARFNPIRVTWYTIAKFVGVRCDVLKYIDRDAGNTNPRLIGGYGSTWFSMTMGRGERWIDDSFYQFALSGTWYGTELRRDQEMLKDLIAAEFYTSATTAQQTVTVGFSVDGAAAQSLSVVTTNGAHRQLFVDGSGVPLSWASGAYHIKPQIALTTQNVATPSIVGTLKLYYRERPVMTKMLDTTLILDSSLNDGAETQITRLQALINTGPIAVTDYKGTTEYWRIDDVKPATVKAASGGQDNVRNNDVFVAHVHMTRWPVAAGE